MRDRRLSPRLPFAAGLLAVLGLLAGARPAIAAGAAVPDLRLTPIASGLSGVTGVTHAGDGRLFLTLQRGRILVYDGAQVLATPFLDISALLVCCGEQGLLSTAFHPGYAGNGFFFVDYTDLSGRTVIARYRVSASNPNVADPSSGVVLLTIDQPFSNHNGGQLQFGPDGQLYIGMGDGGAADDPDCHAQRMDPQPGRQELLGKLLRIDVDQNVDAVPYHGIPAENPFVATGGPDEAWAIGLRNPWRFSFDRLTGDLYIGDVGQGAREEVDFQPLTSRGGANYGWKIMEGTLCTGNDGNCPPQTPACFSAAFTAPVLDYSHGSGRCSITGGYAYRGLRIPDLYGTYLYGDYCSGEIWGATPGSATPWPTQALPISADNLSTFGEDVNGELYVGTTGGSVFRIDGPAPQAPVIDSIAPGTGYERGGQAVAITGSNFGSFTTVLFGAAPAFSVTVLSPTSLTAIAPPGTGVVAITVSNPGVAPAVRPDAFAYVAIPLVSPAGRATRTLPPRP